MRQNDFVKSNDFSGKKVIPFATSANSPMGNSGQQLASLAGKGNWLAGMRFGSRASDSEIKDFVNSVK
ncbi:MAG: flavodoxin [Anaerovibrio sp.]|nr:flavodoxin [Selenomonadaceae bacterium]MDY6053981.1 flavodoxin [Anaerovibrio sp.]